MFDLASIQAAIRDDGLDGWLLYDFRGINVLARRILQMPDTQMLSRRWFYFIPAQGEPRRLVHRIEPASLDHVPGSKQFYLRWQDLEAGVQSLVQGARRVAMEYVPRNANPYVSRVDAGTIELVRSFGVEVISSADLVQQFLCRLSPAQIETHRRAALAIDRAKDEAFRFIAERIRAGRPALETEVQARIVAAFAEGGLITDHPPIVAVDEHAGDPHYVPRAEVARPCARGALVLIDLWAKENDPAAVFADITWMGYAGESPPARIAEVFDVVVAGRDLGLETVRRRHVAAAALEGWMVDRAVRDFITQRGYGEHFVHRTGHNIGAHADHGDGANLDDLETHDTRALVPGLCFSIEPGVYLPEFGVRSEINVVLESDGPKVYTPAQRELVRVLA
jgi:Xaa-Pro aminopeptidase